MSWKILFIAGLAASLLPLNLQIADYTFPYPILGFGLILLSYLFKPIRFADVLNIAVLVITIILGIFQPSRIVYRFSALLLSDTKPELSVYGEKKRLELSTGDCRIRNARCLHRAVA